MNNKFLLVVATETEVSQIITNTERFRPVFFNDNWDILITGAGIVNTVFHLTQAINKSQYKAILNVGLAGAINKDLHLGEVVNVVADEFGFFGAENHEDFISAFDLGIVGENDKPYINRKLFSNPSKFALDHLKQVNGLTVQTVTGSFKSANLLSQHYKADVETMEGAAVFFVANQMNIPVVQIRAISNYVEPRNRDHWKVAEALKALSSEIDLIVNAC